MLTIPGGFPAVARIAGLNGSSLEPASDLKSIFTSLLQMEPPPGSINSANAPRQDLISYLKQYAKFLQYLRNESLAPSDPEAQQEIHFLFSGSKQEVEKTGKLLSFFGIHSRLREGNGERAETLEVHNDQGASQHPLLYRALGIRLPDQDPGGIRIRIEPAHFQMILNEEQWAKILKERNPDLLFQRFIENPDAMRLYVALEACSQTSRAALADSTEPAKLLQSSEALLLFGPDLSFENGSLIYPGQRQAWTGLPGSPALSLDALLSGNGLPLLFYSALASAPPPVQQYLTDSPERLRSYFEVLRPYAAGGFPVSVTMELGQDLPRILRLSTVTSKGLTLALEEQVSYPLLHWMAPDQVAESGSGPVPLTPKLLGALLPQPGVSPYAVASRTGILEFFRYLEETQSASLADESIKALVMVPEEAPVYLDIIGDLIPDPVLLSKYVEYCAKVAETGTRGWNRNRTRTSQSIFFLISALRREGAISGQEANKLLGEALQAFSPDDEALFALNTAEFLSTEFLPEISGNRQSSGDALLSALSRSEPQGGIVRQGKELVLDLSALKYSRMQQTLESQSYTPIPVLLDIYRLLQGIETAGERGNTDEQMRLVSERLNEIRTAEWTPGDSLGKQDPLPETRIDSIKRKIESAGSWSLQPIPAESPARQIAAQIHTELSVTLLVYCYAYSAMRDTNLLTFDPNFVRKHRFYRWDPLSKPVWIRSHFVQEEQSGGFIEGSLAGLGFELTRLQIAQSNQDFGITSNINIIPAILFSIRQVPPELRTDRSQEYVALATSLGRSVLSEAPADERLGRWARRIMTGLLSPARLEQIEQRNHHRESISVDEILSRSELFLVGQAYLDSKEWEPGQCSNDALCAAADRLNGTVPKPGSVEYNAFREEVRQYGMLLCSRIGLSRFSFSMMDSYERLEKSLHPQDLYERICDLKIRIAELNYALGLPASFEEAEGDMALHSILAPSSPAVAGDWKYTIGRINGLTEKAVLGWVDELMTRGSLSTRLKDPKAPGL